MKNCIELFVVVAGNLCRYVIEENEDTEIDILSNYFDKIINKFNDNDSFMVGFAATASYVNNIPRFLPSSTHKTCSVTIPSFAIDAIWMEVQVNQAE